MQDSVSQRSFYGDRGMHEMGNKAVLSDLKEAEILYIREHENHLSLQEQMRHLIAFHAEMTGTLCIFIKLFNSPMQESL